MGKMTFELTYPDAKQTALIDAMRFHYGQKTEDDQGNPIEPPVDYTPSELRQKLGEGFQDAFESIYRKHQEHLIKQANQADELGGSVVTS